MWLVNLCAVYSEILAWADPQADGQPVVGLIGIVFSIYRLGRLVDWLATGVSLILKLYAKGADAQGASDYADSHWQ